MNNKSAIGKSIIILLFTVIISAAILFAVVGINDTAYALSTDTWDGTTTTSFSGSGTSLDPYYISTCAELAYLAQEVNGGNDYSGKYFLLDDNVVYDLNNETWTPIGYMAVNVNSGAISNVKPFSGIFNGASASVNNLSLDDAYQTVGLFGLIGVGGSVTGINIENVTVTDGSMMAGGIAGINAQLQFRRLVAKVTVTLSSTGVASTI